MRVLWDLALLEEPHWLLLIELLGEVALRLLVLLLILLLMLVEIWLWLLLVLVGHLVLHVVHLLVWVGLVIRPLILVTHVGIRSTIRVVLLGRYLALDLLWVALILVHLVLLDA